jgi:spore coat protein U-like protein
VSLLRVFLFVTIAIVCTPRLCAAQLCTVTTTGVSFGSYDGLSATPLDGLGSVRYECLLPVFGGNIVINIAGGSSNNIMARTMKLLTQSLNYNLYTNAARTTVWGNGTTGANVTRSIPAGLLTSESVSVYGRVPAGQGVPSGLYIDTVTVTVIY